MILVIGPEDTAEYAAALALRDSIVKVWPSVVDDPHHDVRIVAGAKCHGQRVRDIDILLLASFEPGLTFSPFLSFSPSSGQTVLPRTVTVKSLCLVVEVKDHSPDAVRFTGTRVDVKYHDNWHSASEQNENQLWAVKGYLQYHGRRPPHITPLLWLRNVPNTQLPPRPHPILGTPVTWELILNVIAQMAPPRYRDGQWTLSATEPGQDDPPEVADLFTQVVTPTRLDRLRTERLTQRAVDLAPLMATLGTRLLILRGQGGTGKTMRLLQLASELADDQGARVLLLTYNKALVADIRRLLTIMGIRDDVTGGTIHIRTVHSFFHGVLRGLGRLLDQTDRPFLEHYEELKDEAFAWLKAGAITSADIEQLATSDFETFRWDYVFVDEGQDWPSNERDLLTMLYSFSRLVVADGIDQLVRSNQAANWQKTMRPDQYQVITLKQSLRMKAGLARFVTAVARNLGLLRSGWVPNEEIPGGRVIILEGSYFANRSLHDRLITENAEDGNAPIDMLFCVPPQLVTHHQDGSTQSVPATIFAGWGLKTWDGASEHVRDSYPTDINQFRIVQYESCRGLEGWTVVNFALDRFYENKLAMAVTPEGSPAANVPGSLVGDTSAAQLLAARWLMIPLTRAMDTLVIQIESRTSPLYAALAAATTEYADYVQWISLR